MDTGGTIAETAGPYSAARVHIRATLPTEDKPHQLHSDATGGRALLGWDVDNSHVQCQTRTLKCPPVRIV